MAIFTRLRSSFCRSIVPMAFALAHKLVRVTSILRSGASAFALRGNKYIDNPQMFALESTMGAIVSGILLISLRRDWPRDFWGSVIFVMFCCWFSAWMSACALWRVKVFAKMASRVPIKIFMSALLFFVVQWAHIDAAQHLNKLFPVDPNQLPFALNFGTLLATAGVFSMLFIIFLMISAVIIAVLLRAGSRSDDEAVGALFVAFLLVGILAIPLSTAFEGGQAIGLSQRTDILIARVAAETDFTDNSLCENVKTGERVVRLGSQGDRGIAVRFGPFVDVPFRKQIEVYSKSFVPAATHFHAVNCNVVLKP